MLPVRHILEEYLGNDLLEDSEDNFETSINDAKSHNIKSLVQQDLENNIIENKILNGSNSPVINKINSEFENKPLTPPEPLVKENENNDKEDVNALFKPKSTSIRLSKYFRRF